jgi:predicted transcriptional regulator
VAKRGEAIISIKPYFAEAILTGLKTVELRRRIPPLAVGTRLWIYATRPTAAVIGSAIVGSVARGTTASIWRAFSSNAYLSEDDFNAYFEGASEAIAISLLNIQRQRVVGIERLREMRPGFHPPQVIASLKAHEVSFLDGSSSSVAHSA